VRLVQKINRFSHWPARLWKRKGIRVFFYHGIVEHKSDPRLERNLHLLADFKSQLNFLRRFRILSLSDLCEELNAQNNNRKPATATVITFDDGYANNQLAAEVLEAARIPWSIFISTGATGRQNSIWTVELSLLLLHGEAAKLDVFGRVWSLASRQEREATFEAIRHPLKALPANLRVQTMEGIRRQFPSGENQRLLVEFPTLQMLTWSEIRELANAGVEIGSHGVNHEIHHAEQEERVRWWELVESKRQLEIELAQTCRFFAFPNGNFNGASPAEVRTAGYELAFTTQRGMATPGTNPYLVPRLSASKSARSFARNYFLGT
jgi:peptidoglycan/xylan/chitin deacetylase (PgdA/CDA1 family)